MTMRIQELEHENVLLKQAGEKTVWQDAVEKALLHQYLELDAMRRPAQLSYPAPPGLALHHDGVQEIRQTCTPDNGGMLDHGAIHASELNEGDARERSESRANESVEQATLAFYARIYNNSKVYETDRDGYESYDEYDSYGMFDTRTRRRYNNIRVS